MIFVFGKKFSYEGVPNKLVRRHYEDLYHGRVALNVFIDSVGAGVFPDDPSKVDDYVLYLFDQIDRSPRELFRRGLDIVLGF